MNRRCFYFQPVLSARLLLPEVIRSLRWRVSSSHSPRKGFELATHSAGHYVQQSFTDSDLALRYGRGTRTGVSVISSLTDPWSRDRHARRITSGSSHGGCVVTRPCDSVLESCRSESFSSFVTEPNPERSNSWDRWTFRTQVAAVVAAYVFVRRSTTSSPPIGSM